MLLKEYRIPLPFDAGSEYQRGQLYTVGQVSVSETGGGEGVEILEQRPFENEPLFQGERMSGTYTKKVYRVKSKAPFLVRKVFPDSAFVLEEHCWNAYPYTKTVLTNPSYMGKNFSVVVESMHLPDTGETENCLRLPAKLLKQREVVFIDITDDAIVKPNETRNIYKFRSEKGNRGPLCRNWMRKDSGPKMCAYKVVSVEFKWFGIQRKMERMMHRSYPKLFIKFHREMFCLLDNWHDMSLEAIREYEEGIAEELRHLLRDGPLRGTIRMVESPPKSETDTETEAAA
ncbi:hypothetical protein L596_028301 [Steinernema carpocapsae]|uniref:Phosphatidylinositol transfer protein N-terminal domain-containing protein n=1 Tax=Steinernema carpocapsae TaxID=34508 RepID=A0A4U5LY36_STECR|nr:hypothetical protein L596_028301 [Steinernema carpocapsae]